MNIGLSYGLSQSPKFGVAVNPEQTGKPRSARDFRERDASFLVHTHVFVVAVDFKRRRPCPPSFSSYFHVHRTGTCLLRPSALVLCASSNRIAPENLETTYVHAPNATQEDEKRDAQGNREKDAANRKLRIREVATRCVRGDRFND